MTETTPPDDQADALRAQIAELEDALDWMRRANRILRKHLRRAPEIAERGTDAAAFAPFLEELRGAQRDLTAAQAAELLDQGEFPAALFSKTAGKIRQLRRELKKVEGKI